MNGSAVSASHSDERLEQPRLVHLGGRDRQREPVAEAERPRRLVAKPRELAHVVGDDRADRLRRLPCLAPLRLVVARPEDLLDPVVVDGLAAHDAAMLGEPRLDRRLELDDAVTERLRHLLRDERVVKDVELSPHEPLAAVRTSRLDRAEELRVGHGIGERELRLDPAPLVLVRRVGVRVPPRPRRRLVQRSQPRLGVLDDARGVAHRLGA